jgi:UDP-glucose 4-epimerase
MTVTGSHKTVVKWLVTGDCGFLGTAPIRVLAKEGGRVVRVDNLAVGIRDDLRSISFGVEHITLPGAAAGSV